MRVDFESPNPVTRCFGGIAGANSAARGADGLAVLLGLQHAVHGLVAVEEHVRAAGNEQALQRVGVELFQRVELLEHGRDVHHHPVANEVHAVLLQIGQGMVSHAGVNKIRVQRVDSGRPHPKRKQIGAYAGR